MFNPNIFQSNPPPFICIPSGPPFSYYPPPPPQQYNPCLQVYNNFPRPLPPVNTYMMPCPANYRFQAPPPPQQTRFIQQSYAPQQSFACRPMAATYAPAKRFNLNPPQVIQVKAKPSVAKSNNLLIVDLHSSKAGHEKETCSICRKATAELLRLPSDVLLKSYQQVDEYSLFKSDLTLFSNPPLQKPNNETSNFQFARNQRFSKESCIDSLDESWVTVSDPKSIEEALKKFALDKDRYSNATTIECEESQDAQSVQAENLDFKQQISPVTQNGLMKKFSTPITSASKDIMTVWKTPIVIDPSLSPRYDEVFPSLPLGEKKPCPRRVLRYNPAVSAKSRK